jgi:hypothetical protein
MAREIRFDLVIDGVDESIQDDIISCLKKND